MPTCSHMTNNTKPKRIILKSAGINQKIVAASKKTVSKNKPKLTHEQYLSQNPKAAKKERFHKACEIKKRLCQDFPKAFDKKQPRPLAKGVHKLIHPKYPEYSNNKKNSKPA